MRATHTPGPWGASVGAGHVAIMTGPTIDTVLAYGVTSTPEGVANARLMAAAPRMLDALERLVPWACKALVEGVHRGCVAPNDLNASINYARAAIARATGRPVGQGEGAGRPDPLDVLQDVLAWYSESTDDDANMPPELHARVVRAVGGEATP